MFKNILLCVSILSASSIALSETTIPNVFSTGDDIVAADMNQNFDAAVSGVNANETALEALTARVDALELANNVSFEGTYRLSGLEIQLDSCSGAPQINHSKVTGTVTSNGGVLLFESTQTRFVLRNGHLDNSSSTLSTETLSDGTFELVIDGTGAFQDSNITGGMSEDGSTFALISSGSETTDCESIWVTQFIGVRVSQ